MKTIRKILAAALAVILTLCIAVPAFAADKDPSDNPTPRPSTRVGTGLTPSNIPNPRPQPQISDPSPFSDVNDKQITDAYLSGLVAGYEDGTFRPLNTITQGEFAQILYKAFGNGEEYNAAGLFPWWTTAEIWLHGRITFWSYPASHATFMAYFDGDCTNGVFRAEESARCVWMIEMLYVLCYKMNGDELFVTDNPMEETLSTEQLEADALAWAEANGYGLADTSWRHESNLSQNSGEYATRAEALQLIMGLQSVVAAS